MQDKLSDIKHETSNLNYMGACQSTAYNEVNNMRMYAKKDISKLF